MFTARLEERFHILEELITEYAVSLPIILPDQERIFSYGWIKEGEKKRILIHDLYILDRKNAEVRKEKIEETGAESRRIAEGLKGIAAYELEEKYMELYEEIRENYYSALPEKRAQLKGYFEKLITDEALIEIYKKYGKEMFW